MAQQIYQIPLPVQISPNNQANQSEQVQTVPMIPLQIPMNASKGGEGDALDKAMAKYKNRVTNTAAKIVEEQENLRRDERDKDSSVKIHDNELDYTQLDTDDLEKLLVRYKKGSRDHEAVLHELRRREAEEEFSDFSEFGEEVEEVAFFQLRVDDMNTGEWITHGVKCSFESKDEMIESIKNKYPFATKIKWSKAIKDGVDIPGTTLRIRTVEEAKLALDKAKQDSRGKTQTQDLAFAIPTPSPAQSPAPANLSSDLKPLFEALSNQQIEMARGQAALIQTLLVRPKEDESEKMMKYMMMMKEMMVSPIVEMMKANQPKPSDPKLSMDLTRTILESATSLHKLNGSGGASSSQADNGILTQLLGLIQPALMKAANMQQPAPTQSLPAPQTPSQDFPMQEQEQDHTNAIIAKFSTALGAFVSGKLPVHQLPRWSFRNLAQQELVAIVNSDLNSFSTLVKSAAKRVGLIEAYFSR